MSVQLFCLFFFFFLIGKVVLGLPWWLSSKESTCDAGATGDAGSIPGSGRSREEGMATHSSVLAWEIPWTDEPGGGQSTGSQSQTQLK